jgi:hypothetical protein
MFRYVSMFQQHAISLSCFSNTEFSLIASALKLLQMDVTVAHTQLAAAGVPNPACAGFEPM